MSFGYPVTPRIRRSFAKYPALLKAYRARWTRQDRQVKTKRSSFSFGGRVSLRSSSVKNLITSLERAGVSERTILQVVKEVA